MHIAARGFHGLGDINARGTARIGVKVVAPKLPPTTRFIKPSERPTGTNALPLTGDTLAGSLDGVGGAYGERIQMKAKKGLPLTAGEKAWLNMDRTARRVSTGRRECLLRAKAGGARYFVQQDAGMGSILSKAVKSVSKAVSTTVAAPGKALAALISAPVALIAPKTGAAMKRSLTSATKVAGAGMFGVKSGLTSKQLKWGSNLQKGLIVAGTTGLTLGIGTGIASSLAAAKAAAAAAAGGLSGASSLAGATGLTGAASLLGKAAEVQKVVSTVRKDLGLPPITLTKTPAAVAQEIQGNVAAGMTPEQAAAKVVSDQKTAAQREVRAKSTGVAQTAAAASQFAADAKRARAMRQQTEKNRLQLEAESRTAAEQYAAASSAPAVAGESPKPEEAGFGVGGMLPILGAALLVFAVAGGTTRAGSSEPRKGK